jgi:hypothetical protein
VTATELQDIARVLSNSSWCRYWLNWDDRQRGQPTMAIQCIDPTGMPQKVSGSEGRGFAESDRYVYTILRTEEDGKPFLLKPI